MINQGFENDTIICVYVYYYIDDEYYRMYDMDDGIYNGKKNIDGTKIKND
jgi:hypothetical protein